MGSIPKINYSNIHYFGMDLIMPKKFDCILLPQISDELIAKAFGINIELKNVEEFHGWKPEIIPPWSQ